MVKQFSANREYELSDIIQKGIIYKDKKERSEEEERMYKDAENARELLLLASTGLATSAASRYSKKGYSFDDLEQVAREAIMDATLSFSKDYNTRFSTYAYRAIEMALNREIGDKKGIIHIPAYKRDLYVKMKRFITEYFAIYEEEPLDEEISLELGITPYEVIELKKLYAPVDSLDRPVNDNGDLFLGDAVMDINAMDPSESLEKEERNNYLFSAIDALDERKKNIIRYVYGIGCESKSLHEIGEMMNLSSERIRQLKDESLKDLYKLISSREAELRASL